MDYAYSIQETTAASAAIRSLQQQLKEMRQENSKLQSELHLFSTSKSQEKDEFEKHLYEIKEEYLSRETAMKQDLVSLCKRVQYLEQENFQLLNENRKSKDFVQEGKQSHRMIILLQDEINILNKQLQQKEAEQELLDRRIKQLENHETRPQKQGALPRSLKESGKTPLETKAEILDSELLEQKTQYREYLKNPNPASTDWKQKVENLKMSIESNSQELLKIRREQHDYLKSYG